MDGTGGAIWCGNAPTPGGFPGTVYTVAFDQVVTRPGAYTATIVIDGHRYQCAATLPASASAQPSCSPPNGAGLPDVSWRLSSFPIETAGLNGFETSRAYDHTYYPQSVTIELAHEGSTIGGGTFRPAYGCWAVGWSLWCWSPRALGRLVVSLPP